jgi:hypothetical protein
MPVLRSTGEIHHPRGSADRIGETLLADSHHQLVADDTHRHVAGTHEDNAAEHLALGHAIVAEDGTNPFSQPFVVGHAEKVDPPAAARERLPRAPGVRQGDASHQAAMAEAGTKRSPAPPSRFRYLSFEDGLTGGVRGGEIGRTAQPGDLTERAVAVEQEHRGSLGDLLHELRHLDTPADAVVVLATGDHGGGDRADPANRQSLGTGLPCNAWRKKS